MLFDTHLHLIYKDRLSYPWLEGFEVLNRDSRFEAYTRDAARLGINGCLHMEVDVADHDIENESKVIDELIAQPGSLLRGIISSCRPESPDFPAFLERARSNPNIKGFRRVLHVVPDEVSTTVTFRENIKRLSGSDLTFDVCVLPHQLKLALELVSHCPEVTFILDHCGVPEVAKQTFEPWRSGIKALASHVNVVAKISGVVAYGNPDTWTLDDIKPYVEETVETFGTERIVWGSDSPVCNLGGGLSTWVAATHALTENWSSAEREALYRLNACRLWRL